MSNSIQNPSLTPISQSVGKQEPSKLRIGGVIALIATPIAIGGALAAVEFLMGAGTLASFMSLVAIPFLMTPPGLVLAAATAIIFGLIGVIIAVATKSAARKIPTESSDLEEVKLPKIQHEEISLKELFEQNIQLNEAGYPTDETCLFITGRAMMMDYKEARDIVRDLPFVKKTYTENRALLEKNNALTSILKRIHRENFTKDILSLPDTSPINQECADIVKKFQEEEKRIQLLEELNVDINDDSAIFSTEEDSSTSTEVNEPEVSDDSLIITERQWLAQEAIKKPFALLHLLSFLMPRSKENQTSRTKAINELIDIDSSLLSYFDKFCNDINQKCYYAENPVENSLASIIQKTFSPEDLGGSLIQFLERLTQGVAKDNYDPFNPLDFNRLTLKELYTTVPLGALLFNSIFSDFFIVAEMSKKDVEIIKKDLKQKIETAENEETKNTYKKMLKGYKILTRFNKIPTGLTLTAALKASSPILKMVPDTMLPEDAAIPLLKTILIEQSLIPYLSKNTDIKNLFSTIIEDLQSYQGSKEERKMRVRARILENTQALVTDIIDGFIKELNKTSPDELNAILEAALAD